MDVLVENCLNRYFEKTRVSESSKERLLRHFKQNVGTSSLNESTTYNRGYKEFSIIKSAMNEELKNKVVEPEIYSILNSMALTLMKKEEIIRNYMQHWDFELAVKSVLQDKTKIDLIKMAIDEHNKFVDTLEERKQRLIRGY